MDKLEYLGRNLNQRTNDVAERAGAAMQAILRRNGAEGRLASGATLLELRRAALEVFNAEFAHAAQFAFNLTESHGREVQEPLAYSTGRMIDIIMEMSRNFALRTGIQEATIAGALNDILTALRNRNERLIEDFSFGMMGTERLKKDPVVNVVNNMTNSPGAVQQTGVGKFSQHAFTKHHGLLLAEIEAVLNSPAFAALQQDQKDALTDVADALKDEAAKETPHPGKLKRWGERLVALTRDFGLQVASGTIAGILAQMFVG